MSAKIQCLHMNFAIVAANNANIAIGNGLVELRLLFGRERTKNIMEFFIFTPACYDAPYPTRYDKSKYCKCS